VEKEWLLVPSIIETKIYMEFRWKKRFILGVFPEWNAYILQKFLSTIPIAITCKLVEGLSHHSADFLAAV
jgi:hypothetical protein